MLATMIINNPSLILLWMSLGNDALGLLRTRAQHSRNYHDVKDAGALQLRRLWKTIFAQHTTLSAMRDGQ